MEIDRIELADLGTPEAIAEAIIRQIDTVELAVPIVEIAHALDIIEIRPFSGSGFEGGLITTQEKGEGSILYNAHSDKPRQRFTIGHELGHFLMPLHQLTSEKGFYCTADDINAMGLSGQAKKMEGEANRFAANILMPKKTFVKEMRKSKFPDLDCLLDIARNLEVSKEACGRRYVDLSDHACAVVFSAQGECRYPFRNKDFPFIPLNKGDPLPSESLSQTSSLRVGEVSGVREVSYEAWFAAPNPRPNTVLLEQTVAQKNGFRMTLLHFDEDGPLDEDDESEVLDRWNEPQFSYK